MAKRNKKGALTAEEKRIAKVLLAKGYRNQDIQALINIGRGRSKSSTLPATPRE